MWIADRNRQQIRDPSPHESGKIMVCGHTSQKSGEPLDYGHAVCIDTWAHGGGWLTCLDVSSRQYWQANQQGQVRVGRLGDVV
jgi:serine/threonine protein phosphatase 1